MTDAEEPISTDELLYVAWGRAALGEFDGAAAFVERALHRDRASLDAWSLRATLPGFVPTPADCAAVAAIEVSPKDLDRVAIKASTLGAMYEAVSRYDDAWRQFETMNEALRKLRPYDPSADRVFLEDVRANLDGAYFADRAHLGLESTTPILVFGLPRSGTTLVERILASHPEVRAGGEMDAIPRAALEVYRSGSRTGSYVRELPRLDHERWRPLASSLDAAYARAAGRASRVTDKLTSNDHHIGLLAVVFPHASFVRVHRDPLDVCVSNYKLMYATRQPQANDFDSLAQGVATHRALMEHWRVHAPVQILDVSYEELVSDQVAQTKRLLDHCRLAWNDTCLRFHETPGTVVTASRNQVRQPIYSSSIGAWRRYEPHLDGLRAALARAGETT